jgi:nucleoside-diphosphate-sugar epimerase
MTGTRALVTGAPGWLGSSLVEALARGMKTGPVDQRPEPVRVLALPGSDTQHLEQLGDVQVALSDLRDRRLPHGVFDGIETVFHCAGIVHPRRIEELYSINVEGTRNLLSAAIAAGVKRFIYVSSNSPAGLNVDPTRLMVEDDPPRPYLNYGLSKLQSEWAVLEAHRAGRIEAVILRPCWFYGPNQPLRQTRFFKMIKGGHPLVFGKGDNLRSMSYVDNTVQGLLLARDVDRAAGQTYWIADRRPYSFIEILETVGRLLGVSIRPRYLPRVGCDVARFADSLMQMAGLYWQDMHVAGELAASIAVSIEKAQQELGYSPEIELEEGMRRSIEWCRSVGVDI